MTKSPVLAIVLLAATATLAACSPADQAATGHAAGEAPARAPSAGLPEGHAAAGEQLATVCTACHGAQGNAPIDASYPKIGGQYYDYIAQALQMYRSGQRGGSPTADIMAAQAKALTDQQIADLAAHFGAQPSQLRDLHGL